jgi:hypothetical protein
VSKVGWRPGTALAHDESLTLPEFA